MLEVPKQICPCHLARPRQGKHLCYVSLEELAKEPAEVRDLTALTFFYIDEALLLKQEQFFEYTRSLISYVNAQGQANRAGLNRQYQPPTPVQPLRSILGRPS